MGGPHNKSIYKWIFIINHPFSGTPIYGDLYIFPIFGTKKVLPVASCACPHEACGACIDGAAGGASQVCGSFYG